jgi:hypothetical protein
MLFLDGVYVERPDGSLHFRWVRAPTSAELAGHTQTLARRLGRFLECQGLLERDVENSYLAGSGAGRRRSGICSTDLDSLMDTTLVCDASGAATVAAALGAGKC